jgi:hypothetical protein|tara:strand:+ start:126 stop:554 length:429 start_codon:yes stop_codon:yes gene_type:complete
MVVFKFIKQALPIAAIALGLFAVANIITKPGQASQTAGALGQTLGAFGSGLSSIGGGVSDLLGGIGGGSRALISPLFDLKELFGVGFGGDPVAAVESERTQSSTSVQDPVVNTAGPNVSPSSQTVTFNRNLAGGGFSASSFF